MAGMANSSVDLLSLRLRAHKVERVFVARVLLPLALEVLDGGEGAVKVSTALELNQ